MLKQDRRRKRQERERERGEKIERGAQGGERMAAADKLQARNAQTTAVYENDESGIIVTLQRMLSSRDIFFRDNIYLSQHLRSEEQ